jgi:hypothetical protein
MELFFAHFERVCDCPCDKFQTNPICYFPTVHLQMQLLTQSFTRCVVCLYKVNKKTSLALQRALEYLCKCILSFFLSFSVSSQCAGSEVKPLTEDRGCDSVLLGQSNRTPHGTVIDEYGAMVE